MRFSLNSRDVPGTVNDDQKKPISLTPRWVTLSG